MYGVFSRVMRIRASLHTTFIALLLAAAFCGPAIAHTDQIYFWVNNDSTKATMIQGDSLAWGANCGVGATLVWEIWYDVNNNGAINVGTDVLVTSYPIADGDTSSWGGPSDVDPVPNGFFRTWNLLAGIAGGKYVFRVTDNSDASSTTKSITVTPLPSPPNTMTGKIVVPGHTPPDPAALAYRWVQADLEDDDQIWSAFTNDSGNFTINIGSIATGLAFHIGPPDIPGYVAPSSQIVSAVGHKTLADFVYTLPTDSVFGTVKDDLGNDLDGQYVFAQAQYGSGHKETQVAGGQYKMYFGLSELDVWWIGVSPQSLVPNYMAPLSHAIDNTVDHSIEYNIVCPQADTVVYVKVTENGGLPGHPYHVQVTEVVNGYFTEGYTGAGAGNIVPMHVSHLYDTGWYAMIVSWDTLYPVPPNLVLDGSENHSFGLGDTLTFNLVSGKKVSDTITVDPGDPLPHWDSVWVGLCNLDGCKIANFDSSGVYTIYADTGEYTLGAFAPMYLAVPTSIDLHLTKDTAGGLGFELNRTHCRVHGTLTNVVLPLSAPAWIIGYESGSGITTSAEADPMTGNYELYLCDGDWSIAPPSIPGRTSPAGAFLTIFEMPDSTRLHNFTYTVPSDVEDNSGDELPDQFALGQNYPNPFNPTTVINFALPHQSLVRLIIYNALGQEVRTLINDQMPAGNHSAVWNGRGVAGHEVSSGIYFYRLLADSFSDTKKMVLLK